MGIEQCITHAQWNYRDAAVLAFGVTLSGTMSMGKYVPSVLPIVVKLLETDENDVVKETAAWTVGQAALYNRDQVREATPQLLKTLVNALSLEPPIACKACDAILYVVRCFEDDQDEDTSQLSQFFAPLIQELVKAAERSDADENNLRIHLYEAINQVITCGPRDTLQTSLGILGAFLDRLDKTFTQGANETNFQFQNLISTVVETIC